MPVKATLSKHYSNVAECISHTPLVLICCGFFVEQAAQQIHDKSKQWSFSLSVYSVENLFTFRMSR